MKRVIVSDIAKQLQSGSLAENDQIEFACKVGDIYRIFGRTMFQAESLVQDEKPGPKSKVLVRLALTRRKNAQLVGPFKILQVKGRVRWMHAPTGENPEGVFVMASELSIPSSNSSNSTT